MSGTEDPTTGDPDDPPWKRTKGGGLNVAMPIPPSVVEKLGGVVELETRMHRLHVLNTPRTDMPVETLERLSQLYTELLTTLETAFEDTE